MLHLHFIVGHSTLLLLLPTTTAMVKPTPDNVKEILNSLSGPQQVTMRSYIASLRAEIKDLEGQLLAANDEDPHAHYHGHEKVRKMM